MGSIQREMLNTFAECDAGEAAVGRIYRTAAAPQEVIDYYTTTVPRRGWHVQASKTLSAPSAAYDGDLFRATSLINGKKAYLVLWYHDRSSELLDGEPEGPVYVLDLGRRPRTVASWLN